MGGYAPFFGFAVVDVSDIATHFFFKRLIAESKNLVVIISVIKRFGAIN